MEPQWQDRAGGLVLREVLEGGEGGGGLGPKSLCSKNGPTRLFQLQISFFLTMVPLVLRGGSSGRVTPAPLSSYGARPF